MLNLPSIMPAALLREGDCVKPLSRSEQVLYWTIVLTPLWWLAGIQPLFYPAVVVGLMVLHFDLEQLVRVHLPACVWAWLVMAIVMLWTAILGLQAVSASTLTVAATLVTFFKSYFLIFSCLALPFWSQVRVRVITRAIAWMSAGYLVTSAVELAMLTLRIKAGYLSPLARLIPGDKGSLYVAFASPSSFLGLPLPRTLLYTPDPPILGTCAILCFLICLGESNRNLRLWALAGALVALILSASRSALVCFPLALLIGICFQSGLFRQLSLWLTSIVLLVCSILGRTLSDLLDAPSQAFDQARADSSTTRALVVEKTLEAWQQSPWVGWGIIRGAVNLYEDSYITLGSFSTYAAVLYLNGIVGFAALICAMILTLSAVYTPAMQEDLAACKWAFASLVTLYILLNATPLSWMAVYLWFFFVWLGAVILQAQPDRPRVSSWHQLSGQG